MRFSGFSLITALALALCGGCKKSSPEEKPQGNVEAKSDQKAAFETAARVHWVGMKNLLAQSNAAGFKKVWDLPETTRLETQTLDRFALAPWRHSIPALQAALKNAQAQGATPHLAITNYQPLVASHPGASLLRPLLDDLVQEECYLEIRHATNQPGDTVLAIRCDEARGGLWQTNLAAVLESLTGVHPSAASSGWSLQATNGLAGGAAAAGSAAPGPRGLCNVQLLRASGWTLVGASPDQNSLLKDLSGRIGSQTGGNPFAPTATNDWLEGRLDPSGISAALGLDWKLPANEPVVALAFTGDGTNVVTDGKFQFPKALALQLEPWNIPTNLIHEPLFSFSAVRGVGPWLTSRPFWQNLQAGAAPNQLFCWAQSGTPFLDFFAAPLVDARNVVDRLGQNAMSLANPILASNRFGVIERSTNGNGIVWQKAPLISPFLETDGLDNGSFIVGGLTQGTTTNSPPPAGTLADLVSQTNLVYYSREITGARLEAWMYVSQLFRLVFRRGQIPGDSGSLVWFKALVPNLGPSRTVLTQSGPTELLLNRTSTIALTGVELHALSEWLESPDFPAGFYSALSKLPPPPTHRLAPTNAPPPRL